MLDISHLTTRNIRKLRVKRTLTVSVIGCSNGPTAGYTCRFAPTSTQRGGGDPRREIHGNFLSENMAAQHRQLPEGAVFQGRVCGRFHISVTPLAQGSWNNVVSLLVQ